jgi:hypothetical protein
MGRGLINSFEIKSRTAFRNLKSAILLCPAMEKRVRRDKCYF